MNRIGIDLGGTKIEGILLDESGNILERKRVPTNRENGYKYIVDEVVNLIKDLHEISKTNTTVGICTPGAISPHTGKIKNSNTVCLIGKPFGEDIEAEIGCKNFIKSSSICCFAAESKIRRREKLCHCVWRNYWHRCWRRYCYKWQSSSRTNGHCR
ncbi:ROK family protein [Candidatus Neomarinimicrobiota bacterium]